MLVVRRWHIGIACTFMALSACQESTSSAETSAETLILPRRDGEVDSITDKVASIRMDPSDVVRDLTDRSKTSGTLLIGLKEPNAVRGVGVDGRRLPRSKYLAAESAVRRDFPEMAISIGTIREFDSYGPGGFVRDTVWRTYITARPEASEEFIRKLYDHPNVDFVSPNYSSGVRFTDSETVAATGEAVFFSQVTNWGVDSTRARDVWAMTANGNPIKGFGVSFGAVDTGADIGHPTRQPSDNPDFAYVGLNGMWSNFTAHHLDNACRQPLSQACYWEFPYHGSFTLGAGFALENTWGSEGVAPANTTPRIAKIQYTTTSPPDDGGDVMEVQDFADAVDWITDRWDGFYDPIRVAYTSVGWNVQIAAMDQILRPAFQRAENDNHVLWFAAAGNQSAGPMAVPAIYPEVVAVGSVNMDMSRTTNSPPGVELVAPGRFVQVTDNRDNPVGSLDGETISQGGTSIAAPIAAAVGRLAMQRFPGWTAAQLRAEMTDHARDLGSSNEFGAGLTDALCLITQVSPCVVAAPPPPPITVFISGPSQVNMTPFGGFCTWTAIASGGTGSYTYQWSGVLTGTQQSVSGNVFMSGNLTVKVTSGGANKTTSKSITVTPSAPDC